MTTQSAVDITLNGDAKGVASGSTVADVLRMMRLDPSSPKGIAVAVNDEVVRKGEWNSRELGEGDRVEVITARQGG